MIRLFSLAAAILLTAWLWSLRAPGAPTHQVFWGGDILTMDGDEIAEAVYVRDGIIVAVGEKDAVFDAAPWNTHRVFLDGETLMPGLIEPHTHPLASALLGAATDISGTTHSSRDEIIASLQDAAGKRGLSPWLVAFGWDPAMIEGLVPPTRAELDAIAPDRPMIILTQMMHEAFVNSAALDAAGITADTADPDNGHFERDRDGNPTGRLIEISAIAQLMAAMPQAPDQAMALLLSLQYDRYARAGYTTIGAVGIVGRARDPLAVMRTVSTHSAPSINTLIYTAPEHYAHAQELWTGESDTALNGVKIWMDGSPFIGGAALAEPYQTSHFTETVLGLPADWRGTLNYSAEDANALVLQAQRAGYQIAIHAQGEPAIERALDAIEAAQMAAPNPRLHHRLEHLALITEAQITRATDLGVSLGFFIDHITSYGHILPDLVGQERTQRYMPVGDAVRSGAVVTLHGDHPATPVNALRVLTSSLQRQTRLSGEIIGPDQRITTERALQAMTLGAARQLGIDDQVGSIEIGKRADFTRLSGNPYQLSPDQISQLTIRSTWIAGRRIDTRRISLKNAGLAFDALWASLFAQDSPQ
jgi:predicted amidohydrolase YtcJ